MVVVILACGIVSLPKLGIHSVGDFWTVAREKIWTGGEPLKGVKFTFWHVMFFAWFCNAAVHIGMADMSLFRYARKWQYGASSAAGMFVGHYLAWICASLLYAVQLAKISWHPPMTPPPVAPGPMAYDAVGIAGLLCVMLAGWTTANPTIYRAGLAFQAILPKSSRFTVTLLAGGLATLCAIFPALVMKLLDFVALYGTILMPMGAVIFVDFWLLKKFSLIPDYAEENGTTFNWAAALAWVLSLAFCVVLNQVFGMQIYFLALPGWLMAGTLYLVLSKLYQQKILESACQSSLVNKHS
jgi:purine-cytosine permease-like protein